MPLLSPSQRPFLVPGSSRVEDTLGDTIPPVPPVLRSLFNLVPADAHFPEIFINDIFLVLSRSTWPPPETTGFPYELVAEVCGDPFVKDVQAISDVCI